MKSNAFIFKRLLDKENRPTHDCRTTNETKHDTLIYRYMFYLWPREAACDPILHRKVSARPTRIFQQGMVIEYFLRELLCKFIIFKALVYFDLCIF